MSSWMDTYWDVDGVSLQTYCRNVTSLAPKWSLPVHRGSNTAIAYRHGSVHRDKYLESRTETLGMWVTDGKADGTAGDTWSRARRFERNMRDLQQLLFRIQSQEVALTKRWYIPESGLVASATAMAELVGDPGVEMKGPYSAKMAVDFLLADPLYYGTPVNVTLVKDTPQTVPYVGDVKTTKIFLRYDGALSNGEVENSTLNPDVRVKLGSAVALGDFVTLDVDQFTAVRSSDNVNLIGAVSRTGSREWMSLVPGGNNMLLTATSGTGTVTMTYAPAYL